MSLPEDLEAEAALLGDLINGSSGGAALEWDDDDSCQTCGGRRDTITLYHGIDPR